MVDLPVPLGPSTLTNTPRCCLEKGRSFIAAPIGWQAAQLVERTCRSNVHEQSGRYQYVVGGSVWRQAIRELSRQCEGVDERAETVARLARQQATGKLERVEDLGTLPIVERALQHTDIYAGIMGDERGVLERTKHLTPDVRERRRLGQILVADTVNLSGHRRDGPLRAYQPARWRADDAADDRHQPELDQVGRLLAVALDVDDDVAEARLVQSAIVGTVLPSDISAAMSPLVVRVAPVFDARVREQQRELDVPQLVEPTCILRLHLMPRD